MKATLPAFRFGKINRKNRLSGTNRGIDFVPPKPPSTKKWLWEKEHWKTRERRKLGNRPMGY